VHVADNAVVLDRLVAHRLGPRCAVRGKANARPAGLSASSVPA
jgi:hypothetical protein